MLLTRPLISIHLVNAVSRWRMPQLLPSPTSSAPVEVAVWQMNNRGALEETRRALMPLEYVSQQCRNPGPLAVTNNDCTPPMNLQLFNQDNRTAEDHRAADRRILHNPVSSIEGPLAARWQETRDLVLRSCESQNTTTDEIERRTNRTRSEEAIQEANYESVQVDMYFTRFPLHVAAALSLLRVEGHNQHIGFRSQSNTGRTTEQAQAIESTALDILETIRTFCLADACNCPLRTLGHATTSLFAFSSSQNLKNRIREVDDEVSNFILRNPECPRPAR